MTQIGIIDMRELDDDGKQAVLRLAMSMYLGETCPYCMVKFDTLDDLKSSVWNGPTEYGRIAHGDCFFAAHPEVKRDTPTPPEAPHD